MVRETRSRAPWLRVVVAWTAVFVVHRAAILKYGFDATYYWEECYRVLAATSVWQGWGLGLYELQADPYAGGSLVVSLFAVPFIALFGPTLTSLKLAGIAWTAVGFFAWMTVVWRRVGSNAAHVFALLFIFAPPLFLDFNLIVMGSHWETVTLAGLHWWATTTYVSSSEKQPGPVFLWGLIAGLGIWFTYVSAVVLLASMLYGIAAGGVPRRHWGVFGAGLAIGLAPLVAYNVANSGSGFAVVARTFMPLKYAGDGVVHWYLAASSDLVKKALLNALQLSAATGVSGIALARLYWLIAWVCVAGAILRAWRSRSFGFVPAQVVCLAISLLLVAGSEHTFQEEFARLPVLTYRVLVPILPAVFAICASELTAGRGTIRALAVAVLVFIGCVSTLQVASVGAARRASLDSQALRNGAEVLGHLLVYRRGGDVAAIHDVVRKLPIELRGDVYRGVGFSLAHGAAMRSSPSLDALERAFVSVGRDGGLDEALAGARLALRGGLEHVPPAQDSLRRDAVEALIDDLDRHHHDP